MPTKKLPKPIETVAAGLKFRTPEDRARAARLVKGELLLLEREPENAHDPNAIKILTIDGYREDCRHIGYVPSVVAREIAPMLDSGVELSCTVVTVVDYVERVPMVAIIIEDVSEP